jgi:hypothetical protein
MGLFKKQNEDKLGVRRWIGMNSKLRGNGPCVEAKRGETRREEQDRKENHLVEI